MSIHPPPGARAPGKDYNGKVAAALASAPIAGGLLRQPAWKAILTDWHFWLPVAVLVAGVGLLAAVR
jgi:hypothetical protein